MQFTVMKWPLSVGVCPRPLRSSRIKIDLPSTLPCHSFPQPSGRTTATQRPRRANSWAEVAAAARNRVHAGAGQSDSREGHRGCRPRLLWHKQCTMNAFELVVQLQVIAVMQLPAEVHMPALERLMGGAAHVTSYTRSRCAVQMLEFLKV